MVAAQIENHAAPGVVVGGAAGGGGQVNAAVECDSSGDESTISVYDDDGDDDLTTDGGGCGVVLATDAQPVPSFGAVSVNNSSDIHFGNKTFYQGPVTIKQVVYASGAEVAEGVEINGPQSQSQPLPAPTGITPGTKGAHDLERRDALKLCLSETAKRRRCLLWLVGLSFLVVLAVSLTLLLVIVSRTGLDADDPTSKRYSGELTYNQPRTKYDVTLSGKLRILDRKVWLAQPATHPGEKFNLPVPYVIISHTATNQCHSQAQCVYIVRITQTFHIESKGWSDIAYNFLVGGDGYVYTGRGWDAVGAHAYGYNVCSIGISFIGTFISEHPNPSQFLAATQLIEEGVRLGKISKDYKLLGHRQVSATESPGQALFDDIKALPHWLEVPLPCSQAVAMQRNTSLAT